MLVVGLEGPRGVAHVALGPLTVFSEQAYLQGGSSSPPFQGEGQGGGL